MILELLDAISRELRFEHKHTMSLGNGTIVVCRHVFLKDTWVAIVSTTITLADEISHSVTITGTAMSYYTGDTDSTAGHTKE